MALNTIAKFNWDKLLGKVDSNDVRRTINMLRAKANEMTASSAKYNKEPEQIDFAGYKKKLRFTASAVDALESAYQKKSLPVFHAELPAFESKKRQLSMSVVKDIVASTKTDLELLNGQLEEFESIRITRATTSKDLAKRFPEIAREIEEEINTHQWFPKTK